MSVTRDTCRCHTGNTRLSVYVDRICEDITRLQQTESDASLSFEIDTVPEAQELVFFHDCGAERKDIKFGYILWLFHGLKGGFEVEVRNYSISTFTRRARRRRRNFNNKIFSLLVFSIHALSWWFSPDCSESVTVTRRLKKVIGDLSKKEI